MPLDAHLNDDLAAKIATMSIDDLAHVRAAIDDRIDALRATMIAQAEALGLVLATRKKAKRRPRTPASE